MNWHCFIVFPMRMHICGKTPGIFSACSYLCCLSLETVTRADGSKDVESWDILVCSYKNTVPPNTYALYARPKQFV